MELGMAEGEEATEGGMALPFQACRWPAVLFLVGDDAGGGGKEGVGVAPIHTIATDLPAAEGRQCPTPRASYGSSGGPSHRYRIPATATAYLRSTKAPAAPSRQAARTCQPQSNAPQCTYAAAQPPAAPPRQSVRKSS